MKRMNGKNLVLLLMIFAWCYGTANAAPFSDEDFFELARTGTPQEIEAAIMAGANVNARDSHGGTPLMLAARNSSPEVITILLENGADINARHNGGGTALINAVAFNLDINPEMITILLESGADAKIRNNIGRTAMAFLRRMSTLDPSLADTDAFKKLEAASAVEPIRVPASVFVGRWYVDSIFDRSEVEFLGDGTAIFTFEHIGNDTVLSESWEIDENGRLAITASQRDIWINYVLEISESWIAVETNNPNHPDMFFVRRGE